MDRARNLAKTIVFSDIDGTLLDSNHRILPRTRGAIERLQAGGVPFVIITARGITGTYPMLEQNGISCTVVCYSGGVILDRDRNVIYHHGFDKRTATEVVSFMQDSGMPAAWGAYSFEEWVVGDRGDPRIRNEERIVMATSREGTIDSIERDEIQKLLLICDPAATVRIEAALRERFRDLAIMRSSDVLIEVMPCGASKAGAVRTLCDLWDVDPADAIAFGDNYNDMPMLEEVGRGYLMGNAPLELLAAFPRHTADNDHDGIAVALEGLALI